MSLILDIRTGYLAIYEGEQRNCLSGVSEDALHYAEGQGEPSQENGYRYVTAMQIAQAKRFKENIEKYVEARIKAERDEAREAVLAEVFEVVRLGQRVKYDGQWVENRIRALMGQA